MHVDVRYTQPSIGERPAGSGVTTEGRKVVVFLAKAGLAAAVFDTTCRAILPSAHRYRDASSSRKNDLAHQRDMFPTVLNQFHLSTIPATSV